MQYVTGISAVLIIYSLIIILHLILPGRWVNGYVTKEGSVDKLRYKLNGLFVLFTTISIWMMLCYFDIISWYFLYDIRWEALTGAIIIGIAFSIIIVVPYKSVNKNFFADLYLGRLKNPQLWNGRIDAKMLLYLIGAVMLELNILSYSAYHYSVYGVNSSMGIFVATGLLSYFIIDYLTFEEVHLYTYDLFAERVGFKLGWGCLAFYPFFYSIPIWSTVSLPATQPSTWALVLGIIVFFAGWSLARGANMQKYYFKRNPNKKFLWIAPRTITDGNKQLLVSGYWGLSRHINYLGEIGMASGIVIATGHANTIWPWLYPLYYVALLFPRQFDDDKICKVKYGKLWDKYVKEVPYRIIPYIY